MTNSLDLLVNVVAIKPFDIGMAAQESRSTSRCTHRGDFPPMLDGSVFYTPMFYNPQASDTILSPESICFHSNGILTSWSQSGSTLSSQGSVSFFNQSGAEVLALTLQKRNGLYYTSVSSFAVDSDRPVSNHSEDYYIYFHHNNDDIPDDISIDLPDPTDSVPAWRRGPPVTRPLVPPLCIPTPKSCRTLIDEFVPKSRQLEADLWQARLGHCSEWQLKVLPMSADGLPSRFYPHPFASYDHYNQARIRKRPVTCGKHNSASLWISDF
jgi:hypothetical protein